MLKKPLAIALLLTFIFNMTGIYIYFKLEQYKIRKAIKHQIKAGIPEEELHTFHLSVSEYENLEWVRPKKEFRHKHEMYDVVRSYRTNDSITLLCVNDHEETILFAKLDQMVKRKLDRESNSPDSPMSKMVKLLKITTTSPYTAFSKDLSDINIDHASMQTPSFYSAPYIGVISPPPELI